MKETLRAFVLRIAGVGRACVGFSVGAGLCRLSDGGARKSFHARSAFRKAALLPTHDMYVKKLPLTHLIKITELNILIAEGIDL